MSVEGDVTPGVYTANGSRWVRQADSEALENLAANIYNTVFGDTIIHYITENMDNTALMDSVINRITNNSEYIEQLINTISTNIYNTVLGDTVINYITQHIQTTELGDSIAYYITQHFETTALGDTIMQYITQNLDRSALMDSIANCISNNNEYLTHMIDNIARNVYTTTLGDTIVNYITQHISTTELGDSLAYYIAQHFETTELGDTIMQYITQNLDHSALMDSVANYISNNNEYLTQLTDNIARNIYTATLGDSILKYLTQNIYHTALGDTIINLVHENERDGIIGNEVTGATANGGLVRSGTGTTTSPYTLGIASGGVTNTHLADNAITSEKISDSAVTSAKIADGTITNADINASAAIALDKIALPAAASNNGKVLKSNGTAWIAGDDSNSDTNTTYTAGNGLTLAGTTFSIGAGQVNGTMIADGAIATAQLAGKSVTVAKVNATGTASSTTYLRGDGSWTTPAGDGQGVTSVSGANGITVTNGTTTPVISLPAGTTNGNVLKWNGTAWTSAADAGITAEQDGVVGNEVINATSGGGLTRSGSGTVASPYTLGISSGGVTNTHLADNSITTAKISNSVVTSAKIAAKTITSDDIANSAIKPNLIDVDGDRGFLWMDREDTNNFFADIETLNTSHLANNAVTSAKIADNTITNADIHSSAGITLNKLSAVNTTLGNAGASQGAVMTWDTGGWQPKMPVAGGVTQVTGSGAVTVTNSTTAPVVSIGTGAINSTHIADKSINAADLNSMGATNGQVLTYNGSAWIPKSSSGPKFLGMLSATVSVSNGSTEASYMWTSTQYGAIGMIDTDYSKRYFGMVANIGPYPAATSFNIYHREIGDGDTYFYPYVNLVWGAPVSYSFQTKIYVLVYEY
jgi:nitrogen regulatory protein PII/uncharacterized protein YerC